jgi:glycosyltransferase involved in cell wall biosynthesis
VKGQDLYIISSSFPYGTEEQFFEQEVMELSKYFRKITIFPLYPSGTLRKLPANVHPDLSLSTCDRSVSTVDYFLNASLLFNVLRKELRNSGKRVMVKKKIRMLANSLLQAKKLARVLDQQISDKKACYYSFWMNDGALLLSLLKTSGKIPSFSFRVNGYDLFDERAEGGYLPFKFFNYSSSSHVIVLSEAGMKYLQTKNIFNEKLRLNYYGLADRGLNPFQPGKKLTIVSCSHAIPLKRLDKIVAALAVIGVEVEWTHFGDGESLNEIRRSAAALPANITSVFAGNVSNDQIIEFYKSRSVDLFIHLSDTEGLGMAIIEAQSFGIPALATDTGGIPDVVNERTGILVPLIAGPEIVCARMKELAEKSKDSTFRINVKEHWKNKFSSENNYKQLYGILTEA